MSNLIITIISLALVAVAAVMAIYYGGTAFEQGQTKAIASAIVSESIQINAAQRLWAINNNQPDATNVSLSTLVSAKYLIPYPTSVLHQLGFSGTLNDAFGRDWGCYNYLGYQGLFFRGAFTYNNQNYFFYSMGLNYPYTAPCGTLTNSATKFSNLTFVHPIVTLAKAINAGAGISNLPVNPGSYLSTSVSWFPNNYNTYIQTTATGGVVTNSCYITNNSYSYVICVFGPS